MYKKLTEHKNIGLIAFSALILIYAPKLFLQIYASDDYEVLYSHQIDTASQSGRWAFHFITEIIFNQELAILPYFYTLISIIFLVLCGILTTLIFEIKNLFFVFITILLCTANPFFAHLIYFNVAIPLGPFSVFCTAFALYLYFSLGRKYLPVILFTVAIGIYQIVIQIALLVIMLYALASLSKKNFVLSKKAFTSLFIVPVSLLSVSFLITTSINFLYVKYWLGKDSVGRYDSAFSFPNFFEILDRFLLKTESIRGMLQFYLWPLLALFLFILVAATLYWHSHVRNSKRDKKLIFIIISAILFSYSIVIILLYPRGLLYFEYQILICIYTIVMLCFLDAAYKVVFNDTQITGTDFALKLISVLIIFISVPVIIQLPQLVGQSIGIRSHLTVGWLAAICFILVTNSVASFRKVSMFTTLALVILFVTYINTFFYTKFRQTQRDILTANNIVTQIRSHAGYLNQIEPLGFYIVGKQRNKVMSPDDDDQQAFSRDWSKYYLFTHFTDFKFYRLNDEIKEGLESAIKESKQIILSYPHSSSIQIINNTVVLILDSTALE